MSISRTVNITCPSCGTQQNVQLYDAITVDAEPHLKDALMHNQLNRVNCTDCELSFRVDLPMLYNDPANRILIHWIPENEETPREQVLEEFDRAMEHMNSLLPADAEVPNVRLVLTRVELVELIYLIEAGLNQRVVEYVKYSIYTRNLEKINPRSIRLLLNVQDSTEDELCFVQQDVQSLELGGILRYGRAAYDSLCELFEESPDEFLDMFPGPCISARNLLLEDEDLGAGE
jgi:transcription elongation factor Elf1